MANLLRKLQDKTLLSDAELIISQYLLENYREFSNMTTRELAKKTFTSSAAIVRFCQKLGFEGYTDFKVNFLIEVMRHGNRVKNRLINSGDSISEIINKVRTINVDAIEKTCNALNPATVERAVNLLKKFDYIDFYATDTLRDFSNRVADSFSLAHKYSTIHYSMPLQYLQAYNTPKNHFGFFVSFQGEERHLIEIAKSLKKQGISTLLITAAPNSSLGNLVNETFVVSMGDNLEDLGPLSFLTGANFISETLLAVLMTQTDYQKSKEKEQWLNKNFNPDL